jgi:hypothetical protein
MKEEKKDPTPDIKAYQQDPNDESGNEDQDSEYEGSSDSDNQKVGKKKNRDLNKAKQGGVLYGRDKR